MRSRETLEFSAGDHHCSCTSSLEEAELPGCVVLSWKGLSSPHYTIRLPFFPAIVITPHVFAWHAGLLHPDFKCSHCNAEAQGGELTTKCSSPGLFPASLLPCSFQLDLSCLLNSGSYSQLDLCSTSFDVHSCLLSG